MDEHKHATPLRFKGLILLYGFFVGISMTENVSKRASAGASFITEYATVIYFGSGTAAPALKAKQYRLSVKPPNVDKTTLIRDAENTEKKKQGIVYMPYPGKSLPFSDL